MAEEFDYVIVGAGSAGCVLANRLSADPATRVLLLEAGPAGHHPAIGVPAAFPLLFGSRVDWAYRTVPQAELRDRRVYWPRGKVLGGSSAINAMMWIRGFPEDYDEWAGVAGPGWGGEALVPYFRRVEDTEGAAADDPRRGVGGPLPVAAQRDPNPLTRAWLAAAGERGIAALGDPGSEGVAMAMVNQRRARRVSAADAYLNPVRRRSNLVVRTGCLAERIVCEEGRARGVDYRQGRSQARATARAEVIVAAGAVNSPQLLMLSGIGPATLLASVGIEVVADRPGVGKNLQDHLTSGFAIGARRRVSLARAHSVTSLAAYVTRRRGPLSSNVAEGYGYVRSRSGLALPDLELLFVPGLFINEGLDIPRRHGFTLAAVLLRPESRGRVVITSPDPTEPAAIDPGYLSDPHGTDAATLRAGIRRCIEIATAPSLAREATDLVQPEGQLGEGIVETALRDFSQTLYHPVGTCRMGTDADSVVDEALRVRGVEGLRVVDASVMPVIPHGHTHAPTVVVAERAADLLRA